MKYKFQPIICISCERDSSGTTEQPRSGGEGDGADSPTRGSKATEAARPKEFCFAQLKKKQL